MLGSRNQNLIKTRHPRTAAKHIAGAFFRTHPGVFVEPSPPVQDGRRQRCKWSKKALGSSQTPYQPSQELARPVVGREGWGRPLLSRLEALSINPGNVLAPLTTRTLKQVLAVRTVTAGFRVQLAFG